MILSYANNTFGEGNPSVVGAIDGSLIQCGILFAKRAEPIWKGKDETVWFDVVLPFQSERSTATWADFRSHLSEQRTSSRVDTAAKLQAFHDWLESLPTVPNIPLEALGRENLY